VQSVRTEVPGDGRLGRRDHRRRATAVDGGAGRALPDGALEVRHAVLVLGEDLDPPLRVGGQLVEERHGRSAPAAVDEPPRAPAAVSLLDHRDDRRDADPPGEEEEACGVDHAEPVARTVDDDAPAHQRGLVDLSGPST